MDCTLIGNWDMAVTIFVLIQIGMILFALFLIVGCVRGIREEQREAKLKEPQSHD
jgi:hypothetical protein